MNLFTVACPNCSQKYKLSEDKLGSQVKCQKCSHPFVPFSPAVAPSASSPAPTATPPAPAPPAVSLPTISPGTPSFDDLEAEEPGEAPLWFIFIAAVIVIGICWVIGESQAEMRYGYGGDNFKSDNAIGATANAVQKLERYVSGTGFARFCTFVVLWMIFVAVRRLDRSVKAQGRLIRAALRDAGK